MVAGSGPGWPFWRRWVYRRNLRKGLIFIMLLVCSGLLFGDWIATAEITGNAALIHEEDEEYSLASYGTGNLDLKSSGNPNVKGELEFDALISETVFLDVPRAYIKVRFPWFRLTAGKTRVSWGEGFLFNAGDVIFEGIHPLANLTSTELRIATDWMLVPYVPLGPFSFIEGILLPHPQLLTVPMATDDPMGPVLMETLPVPVGLSVDKIDRGLRIVTKLLDIKLEGGVLYKGDSDTSHPYTSLKGNLFSVDWHFSNSVSLPDGTVSVKEMRKSHILSLGLFRLINLPYAGSLSLRVEAGIKPSGEWEELKNGNSDGELPDYGLYVFPEVSYSPLDNLSLQMRSIISPVDASALSIFGASWNTYQGFTVSGFISFMTGDEDDIFGWDREGDFSLMTELKYVFGTRN